MMPRLRYILPFRPEAAKLDGKRDVVFEACPRVLFQPERLIVSPAVVLPRWLEALLIAFRWIVVPGWRSEKYCPLDEFPDDQAGTLSSVDFEKLDCWKTRYRFAWVRPTERIRWAVTRRMQVHALRGCWVTSMALGTQAREMVCDPIPIEFLSGNGNVTFPPLLSFARVQANEPIRVTVRGRCPGLQMIMIGVGAEP